MNELIEILDNQTEFDALSERDTIADMVRQVFGEDAEIVYYD